MWIYNKFLLTQRKCIITQRKSTNKRCTNSPNNFCGKHKGEDYINVSDEIKINKCAIGLLTNDEIIYFELYIMNF